ncbi:xanthine dehydrogenase family protein molybdopterin-binding subunit [Oceanicola sp. 502str15]|uniref:xanthine dehydrogenase family protein molybdopterin-binding subunit n=1 Tax=Oceanicola sp. 502str15 TaxID=2696061 RepID=UPI002094B07B|nr:xanthine dehydrogenase family protein molybdopterin-binding subunit [Oceanicola sp. 502str15]MCO6383358.1 molybdopterin-dependent oxidoreductase [Oceanicola sp. 502str15]
MTSHLKMDKPDTRRRLDDMAQGVVGTAMTRPEGPLKVSGTAQYANEWRPEGLCHGVLVRAPVTAGRVTGTSAETVKALPGILAVLTDPRLLRNPAQGTANEAPVQDPSEIAYFGQPVALVVGESFEAARHGAQSLEIKVASRTGAVNDPNLAEEIEEPDEKQLSQGDLYAAMEAAAYSVDETYITPGHNSAAMEPHASIAAWDGDTLTVHGSYQMLKYNVNELADALGIDPAKVRIRAPYVGGGFGAKLGIAPEAVAAALAARELGRPVSVALTRQQVFETTMRRSETTQRIRLAADSEGRLTGIGHEALVSNLPGESFSEPVTQATPFMYRGENREIGHRIARVHRTCAGSVRAPGESVGVTAFETAMDELAHRAGIDPVELRRNNIPEEDPSQGIPFSSHKLRAALDAGAEAFGWSARSAEPGARREGEWLIGHGMASAFRVNILQEAKARVRLHPDGRAEVETDMTDIGTGTYAILGQIAGEMLGLPPERVTVTLGDSALPPGPGSGGSWGAASSGTSVFLACEAIRAQLAQSMGVDEPDLTLKDGQATAANVTRPLSELLDGPCEQIGHVEPGDTQTERRQSTFGAYFAEVAVNAVTGESRVRRMQGAFAAGRILNPQTARSQCIGGMVFGIGMALTEELVHDPRHGQIINHDFAEYHLPVNLDVPQIEVQFIEERDDWANPLQAKGIGELGICGAAAAINNAIFNATGVRVREYPATLDKVILQFGDLCCRD